MQNNYPVVHSLTRKSISSIATSISLVLFCFLFPSFHAYPAAGHRVGEGTQPQFGAGFTVGGGGPLSGSYTIPLFHHCGLNTLLLNLTIPGSGNTLNLTLGQLQLG